MIQLQLVDLPVYVTNASGRAHVPSSQSLSDVEKCHIRRVLDDCDWNITQAARMLEVDRGTLYNKIKKFGLERPGDGGPPAGAGASGPR